MTFQGSGPLSGGNVSAGGSGGGGGFGGGRIALGGGLGLVVTIVAMLFGINPGDIMGGGGAPAGQQSNSAVNAELQQRIDSCTIEDANTDDVCRIRATAISLNKVWGKQMQGYTEPGVRIFSGNIDTACGAASSAMGPFYCPGDRIAYFDPGFFADLKRMGGSDGPLAQEYVVAHEFGHHVQNLTGALAKGQRMGNDGSRRVELQADCLAGVWAYNADKGPDAMLKPLTEDQISTVIQTARAIGDDTIQGAGSNPESWTHGSAQQRQRWFTIGYKAGDPRRCDTFATNDL